MTDRAFRGARHAERELFGPGENERLFHRWVAFLATIGVGDEGEQAARPLCRRTSSAKVTARSHPR